MKKMFIVAVATCSVTVHGARTAQTDILALLDKFYKETAILHRFVQAGNALSESARTRIAQMGANLDEQHEFLKHHAPELEGQDDLALISHIQEVLLSIKKLISPTTSTIALFDALKQEYYVMGHINNRLILNVQKQRS